MSQPPLLDNPFVLAPMAGITDMPFRRLMRKMGAGAVISEFVSAHAIVLRVRRTKEQYLRFHTDESPMGIQIFGADVKILKEAAKIVQDLGVNFVDINMGCPVPKVTRKGGGSAWLCEPVALGQMLKEVKSSLQIPLTIKIRTGWDQNSLNAEELLRIAKEEGVAWAAIHGRTRTQGYAGHADWAYMKDLVEKNILPLILNGDISSGALAAARLMDSGALGVMIGRGALKNPWIFQEAGEALSFGLSLAPEARQAYVNAVFKAHCLPSAGQLPENKSYFERRVKKNQPKPIDFTAGHVHVRADRNMPELLRQHLSYLREMYPEVRVMFGVRKFLAWYAAGYPGAHEFRKFIFNTEDASAILQRAFDFFESIQKLGPKASDSLENQAPLMSGHG